MRTIDGLAPIMVIVTVLAGVPALAITSRLAVANVRAADGSMTMTAMSIGIMAGARPGPRRRRAASMVNIILRAENSTNLISKLTFVILHDHLYVLARRWLHDRQSKIPSHP